MTARSKFHIPSADEMKKDSTKAPEVKSIFKAFKAGEYSDSIPKSSTSNQSTNNFGQVNNAAQYRKVNSARPVSDHSKTVEVPSYKAQHGLSNTGSKKTEISATTTSTSSNQYKKDETKSLPGVSIVKEEKKDKVVITKAGPKNSITVNPRQRGNPILKSIRNVPWEFGEILPDYEMGKATCALFLSLRYHHLNPNYIHDRLRLLGSNYELRVLLVQVDVKDPNHSLKELAKICLLAECTLLLAWSAEEAGRYLETYKAYENKPPESIMERTENDFLSKMTDTLTSVKKVNKTDVTTFLTTFGSFENLVKANKEDLSLCPGVGPQKAQRLYDVFREPFLAAKKRKLQGKRGLDESPSPKKSVKGSPAKASPASKASLTASPAKSLYFKPS